MNKEKQLNNTPPTTKRKKKKKEKMPPKSTEKSWLAHGTVIPTLELPARRARKLMAVIRRQGDRSN